MARRILLGLALSMAALGLYQQYRMLQMTRALSMNIMALYTTATPQQTLTALSSQQSAMLLRQLVDQQKTQPQEAR